MLVYILFALGIFLLIKGADFIVDGSSSLAKKFKISTLVIGLTIVAFGTSLPELIVNIFAVLRESGGIAFGNIIGSSISNILLVLGITALIVNLKVKNSTVKKEIPFSLLAVLVLFLFINPFFLNAMNLNSLIRIQGVFMLTLFAFFLYYVFRLAKKERKIKECESLDIKKLSNTKIFLYIVGGFIALYLDGKWTIDGIVGLATLLGMSEYFISLIIVAVGTSLPELATCITAAIKKDVDLAVGNILGSNIFNILWVLGATSLIAPIVIPAFALIDVIILIGATILLFLFMFLGKKHQLDRWQGFLFVILYILFVLYTILRNGYF